MKKLAAVVLAMVLAGGVYGFGFDDGNAMPNPEGNIVAAMISYDDYRMVFIESGEYKDGYVSFGASFTAGPRISNGLYLIGSFNFDLMGEPGYSVSSNSFDVGFMLRRVIFLSGTMSIYHASYIDDVKIPEADGAMRFNGRIGVSGVASTKGILDGMVCAGLSVDYYKDPDSSSFITGVFASFGL